MKHLIIPALALAISGCATIGKIDTVTNAAIVADIKLRSSCAYLEDGIRIARLAVGFIPVAATYVERGASLADAYCSGRPITDLVSALAAMERVIVAVRPIAARVEPQ